MTALGYIVAIALMIVMCAAVGVALIPLIGLVAVLLSIIVPSSRWVAAVVEGKQHTFTVAGAVFIAALVCPLAVLICNRGLEYLGEDWQRYEDRYQPKTEPTGKQKRRLIEFTKLVNQGSDERFQKEIGNYLDVVSGLLRMQRETVGAGADLVVDGQRDPQSLRAEVAQAIQGRLA